MSKALQASFIYLDNNAMLPLRPSAHRVLSENYGNEANPSSLHQRGQASRSRLENARTALADLLNVSPSQLIFTSGGTESNFLALKGTAPHISTLLIGEGEHDSLSQNAANINTSNSAAPSRLIRLPLTNKGTVCLKALESKINGLQPGAFLVSATAAHHETGVMGDLSTIGQLVHTKGGFFHTDASQALGKIPLDLSHVDLATFSAHKVGGPCGVGALLMKDHVPFTPPIKGGGQENGLRPGTPPVALIESFITAAKEALSSSSLNHLENLECWHRQMEKHILALAPGARVWGRESPRVPQTTSLFMPGVLAETQLMAFDMAGFAVSAGSACRAGLKGPSPALLAMGASEVEASCTIRISSGWQTTQDHLKRFTKAWLALYRKYHPLEKAPQNTLARQPHAPLITPTQNTLQERPHS